VQATYSEDLEQATKNVAFFYVPFAVLFRLAADVPWSPRMLRTALRVVGIMALAFAAVAFVEFATGHLLIPNPKVLAANEAKEYFRVNSLFFDPNIYGRFEALAMVMLATVLLWSRRTRESALLAAALAVLWAGLVLSLSQSSFAALLVGLAVLAAIRWRPGVVAAVAGAAVVAGVAIVVFSPGTFGLKNTSDRALNRATAGRAKLTEGGLEMARDRPVWGYGSGSFATVFRERERVVSPVAAAESHTIPLTVAAEQGLIGILAYLLLAAAALRAVFSGVRHSRSGVMAIARAAIAASFCALAVHTLGYAAFLEDPLTWTLLAIGVSLGRFAPRPAA
jgi:O-antigen ligase